MNRDNIIVYMLIRDNLLSVKDQDPEEDNPEIIAQVWAWSNIGEIENEELILEKYNQKKSLTEYEGKDLPDLTQGDNPQWGVLYDTDAYSDHLENAKKAIREINKELRDAAPISGGKRKRTKRRKTKKRKSRKHRKRKSRRRRKRKSDNTK